MEERHDDTAQTAREAIEARRFFPIPHSKLCASGTRRGAPNPAFTGETRSTHAPSRTTRFAYFCEIPVLFQESCTGAGATRERSCFSTRSRR
jgi:hypothetical protein